MQERHLRRIPPVRRLQLWRLGWALAHACVLHADRPARADVWTHPRPVLALHGSRDILAASTLGGVVLWDLSGTNVRLLTTARGLPSQVATDVQIQSNRDQACAATDNGLARGWFDGTWSHRGARNDENGRTFFSCIAYAGGCIAGGENGALVSWRQETLDSLRLPTGTGRVVGLDVAPRYFDPGQRGAERSVRSTSAPAFPVGLVVASRDDGVWFLRDAGSTPRWLQFAQRDGLPRGPVRDVAVDGRGFVWVATAAGVVRIGPGTSLQRFDADPLLSQRSEVLLATADGAVYCGVPDGVVRIDAAHEPPQAVRVLTTGKPVVALAATARALWWSDGNCVQSLAGAALELPLRLAANSVRALAVFGDSVWVGHPQGRLSRRDATSGWRHHGFESGLPLEDIRSLQRVGSLLHAGTPVGLYEQRGATSLRDSLRFDAVTNATMDVAAQAVWRDAHWIGGAEGLWRREADTWTPIALWPGAREIVALAVVRDTLWATSGYGGIACHVGQAWEQPPRVAYLAGAYWGRLHAGARTGAALLAATNRGVATWERGIWRPVPQTPDEFATDVALWNDGVVWGSARGLWLGDAQGGWMRLGVLDGLAGAQVQRLAVAENALWIGTARGLTRFLPSDVASVENAASVSQRTHVGARPSHPSGAGQRTFIVRTRRFDAERSFHPEWDGVREVGVYDVRGRHVRTLTLQSHAGLTWDTRDSAGRPVAAGVFFLRVMENMAARSRPRALAAGGVARGARLVVMR